MSLPERELQGLLELLGEVHHAEDLASFRAALLDALPRLIPAAYTSYNEVGADGTPLVTLVAPEPPERVLRQWGRYGHQNPLIQRHLARRDPRASRLSDVIALDAFRQRELYREVFVPMGVEHQLAVTLPAPPRLLIGLVFADADDFSDDQRRLLDYARPHLIQAHANAALRERLHDVLRAVEAGLDDVGEAIVVTDAQDRIAFTTQAGRAALSLVGDGHGRLPEPLRGSAAPAHTVVPVADGAPLVVRRLAPRGGATVHVFERGARGAPRSLLTSLGLSPREAEVLQAMMGGLSTAAIAQRLSVQPRTVYKHAERIYAKLGVNDRIAAVSAAWAALDSGR
ncbi:MAG TPA: helix-turn-helix transcriptional regulator [Solirubrobacter sp.]|nr:helix-turn-helix transcriptional regulator [Solirubrobacter sp.]